MNNTMGVDLVKIVHIEEDSTIFIDQFGEGWLLCENEDSVCPDIKGWEEGNIVLFDNGLNMYIKHVIKSHKIF